MADIPENDGTRQDRRAGKLKKKRERMVQHGRGMAQQYKDAVLKKAPKKADDK